MGNNPAYFNGNNRPVECVSWNNAVNFCQKLSQKTGKNYKLPSEAQWEYACRAGTTTPFYFGESITSDLVNYGDYAYAAAPKGKYREQTTDVGTFPPNAFGLYDMHGNVMEWCEDDWQKNYINAPINGSALISRSNIKMLRGGSWYYNPDDCRSAYRYDNISTTTILVFGLYVVVRRGLSSPLYSCSFALCSFFFSLTPPLGGIFSDKYWMWKPYIYGRVLFHL
jgi:formylglycine-generating enzyme required for sulfatase activity